MTSPPASSAAEARSGNEASSSHWLELIRRQAVVRSGAVALRAGGDVMTYGDLLQRRSAVAQTLRGLGIGRGSRVGVGLQRGADLIAALLGIIESGACYLPLAPGYPEDRIERMIRSVGLGWVLACRTWSHPLPGARLIRIEDAMRGPAGSPGRLPFPGDPIYAIFTSGSTGLPKAASVFHSGFSNLLRWYRGELGLGSDDRTLVIISPSFDLTQKNLFMPLITGGIMIPDDGETYDITRILGLIRTPGVTLINCTPSAFYPLVEAAEPECRDIASLRFAVLGGEPISVPRLRAWLDHASCRAEVVNTYGPTECTDICLFHRLHRGNLDDFPFVSLGREVPGTFVTIRDESLNVLPDGEVGVLCITGAGVGGGYLNDLGKTAAKFIDGMYRTGDLAKRHPCGTFEFHVREDHQVKVNGHRIETGEIEIALNDHEAVIESVVVANRGTLVAHVRGNAGVAELRPHLLARLPSDMIPAEFRLVQTFPLTPNGKVDRKTLTGAAEDPALAIAAPAGASMETRILGLWSELLGRAIGDASGNFLDLGGNSIQLAVMHVRLREITGRDFPITEPFARPNARAIAAMLEPGATQAATSGFQDRARLTRQSFFRFQRPASR